MKINFKASGIFLSVIILLGALDSCVKNRNLSATDFSQIQPAVELITAVQTSNTPETSKSITIDTVMGPLIDTERLYVNYAGLTKAPKDITVTLAVDPAGLAAAGSSYVMLSPNAYTFNPTVTIRSGQQFAYVDIYIKRSLINFNVSPALAVKITDAQGVVISANYHNYIFYFTPAVQTSRYEGVYLMKGYILRAGDPVLTGTTGPVEKTLLTVSAYSVRMFENHGWSASSGAGIAATVSNPTYTIDPVTNAVTITSDGGAFPNGMMNLPGFNSHYDPATKTIYAYSTWAGGPGVREMKDTLKFLR